MGRAFDEIPALRQLAMAPAVIRQRAERLVEELRQLSTSPATFSVETVESATGGGSLAGITIPSWAIAISTANAEQVAERLRLGTPAVVGRLNQGRNLVDLRTVLVEDEKTLCQRILDSVR